MPVSSEAYGNWAQRNRYPTGEALKSALTKHYGAQYRRDATNDLVQAGLSEISTDKLDRLLKGDLKQVMPWLEQAYQYWAKTIEGFAGEDPRLLSPVIKAFPELRKSLKSRSQLEKVTSSITGWMNAYSVSLSEEEKRELINWVSREVVGVDIEKAKREQDEFMVYQKVQAKIEGTDSNVE